MKKKKNKKKETRSASARQGTCHHRHGSADDLTYLLGFRRKLKSAFQASNAFLCIANDSICIDFPSCAGRRNRLVNAAAQVSIPYTCVKNQVTYTSAPTSPTGWPLLGGATKTSNRMRSNSPFVGNRNKSRGIGKVCYFLLFDRHI